MAREEYTFWVGALLRIAEGLPSGMGLQYAPINVLCEILLGCKIWTAITGKGTLYFWTYPHKATEEVAKTVLTNLKNALHQNRYCKPPYETKLSQEEKASKRLLQKSCGPEGTL